MSERTIPKSAIVCIAITSLLWSGMETALKLVSGNFNPIQLTFSRVLIGGLILLPFALKTLNRRGVRLTMHDFLILFLLSLLGVTFSICVTQFAVLYIPAALVSAFASTNPIFAVLFSYLILHKPIKKYHVLSVGLALIGITLIIRPWGVRLDGLGLVFAILSPLSFSLYSVTGKPITRRCGGVVVTSFCFLMGAVEMMILSLTTHIPAVSRLLVESGLGIFSEIPFIEGYSLESLPYVLYIFIGGTGIGFACYFVAIEKSSAQFASVAFFVKPVLAPIIAYLLLHETVASNELAGIICIILAAVALVLPELRGTAPETI